MLGHSGTRGQTVFADQFRVVLCEMINPGLARRGFEYPAEAKILHPDEMETPWSRDHDSSVRCTRSIVCAPVVFQRWSVSLAVRTTCGAAKSDSWNTERCSNDLGRSRTERVSDDKVRPVMSQKAQHLRRMKQKAAVQGIDGDGLCNARAFCRCRYFAPGAQVVAPIVDDAVRARNDQNVVVGKCSFCVTTGRYPFQSSNPGVARHGFSKCLVRQ